MLASPREEMGIVPSDVDPSKKVTFPVKLGEPPPPPPVGVTTAVSIGVWLTVDGLKVLDRTVDVVTMEELHHLAERTRRGAAHEIAVAAVGGGNGVGPDPEAEVVKVAVPAETLPVPMEPPLSKKVTVPVSPEPVVGWTVAVKVTDCPDVDGLSELPRLTLVGAWLTTWHTVLVVELPMKLPSPP